MQTGWQQLDPEQSARNPFVLRPAFVSTPAQHLHDGQPSQHAHVCCVCCASNRLLQLLLELPWPSTTTQLTSSSTDPTTTAHLAAQHQQDPHTAACAAAAISCFLSLLHHCIATYPAAARLYAGALAQSQELGAVLCSGLSCPREAVVTPLLQ